MIRNYKLWYKQKLNRIFSDLEKKSKTLSRQGLYEFLAEEYKQIPPNARVLTIGAGGEVNSLLTTYAQKQNFFVTSLDIDPKRRPDIIADICLYNFGDALFDYVVLSEVLEHLHSPRDGLRNIYEALKIEGRLILSTPFILPIHDSPVDYYRFTRYGLALLLKDFADVDIRERNSYFETIDVLWVRLLQSEATRSFVLSLFVIPFIYYIKYPFSRLLSRLVVTHVMTTGYVVSCVKR